MNQLMAGETAYFDYGTPERVILHVRVDRHHGGVAINVITPAKTTLDRGYTNDQLDEARTHLAYLRDAAKAGQPVWKIEAGVAVVSAAQQIVTDADKALIDDINATMDAAERKPVDVSDILDTPAESWDAFRRNTRRDFTRTRVSSQPPTPAQLDRIRQHHDGIVTRAPGQPWVLLKGLVDRGLGQPHEVAGRHVIVSVRLNRRGLALAEQGQVAA